MNVLQPPNAFFLIALEIYFWIRGGFIKRTKAEKEGLRCSCSNRAGYGT